MLEDRLEALFKTTDEYTLESGCFKGSSLVGKKYQPLFPYFADMKSPDPDKGAFRIVRLPTNLVHCAMCNGCLIYSDTYVTAESGTGVVHQAPGFGQDDYRVCLEYGIVKKGDSIVCPVDPCGLFTDKVVDFKGQYVKVNTVTQTLALHVMCILYFMYAVTRKQTKTLLQC